MESKETTDTAPTTVRSTSTDEDDPITTSTESETFGTWTLVSDKSKKQPFFVGKKSTPADFSVPEKAKDNEITEERVEVLREDDNKGASKTEAEDKDLKQDNENSLDDISDGISIISDSESGGRVSPHPFLRHHLEDLNLKFKTGDEFATPQPTLAEFEVKKRRRQRSASISRSDLVDSSLQETEVDAADPRTELHPIIRTGLTGVFYVGVLLAALAFIGRLRYPEWEHLNNNKPMEQLEQKLTDMELQNNLMRAEIDILSKQVNYLSNQQQRSGGKEQKSNKVWEGNEIPQPQETVSRDHGKSYKCQNGKFVANADLCIGDIAPSEKPIEVDNVDDEDDTLKEFEKVVEQMSKFGSNVFKIHATSDTGDDTGPDQRGERKYDRKMAQKFNKDYSEKYSKSAEKHQRHKQHDADSAESNEGQGNKYNGRIHSKERQRYKDDDDDDDNSHERFNKHRNSIFSKEHDFKEGNSKERFKKYDKQQHFKGQHNSKESFQRNEKDGQWHEKLMHHREQERQRNNERQINENKNWYIKRGSSREQMRHGEKRFR